MQNSSAESGLGEITLLFQGDAPNKEAIDQVFPLVYQELRQIAARILARERSATASPTVLVHELYAKLNASQKLSVEGRRHFFSLCARVMKQILLDFARMRSANKRDAGGMQVTLDDIGAPELATPERIMAIDIALQTLQAHDQRLAEIVSFRVFAGLSLEEIAGLYEVTLRQMQREWLRAKIWLSDALI